MSPTLSEKTNTYFVNTSVNLPTESINMVTLRFYPEQFFIQSHPDVLRVYSLGDYPDITLSIL